MKFIKLRNSALLFLTAVIWGSAFVAQQVGMDYIGPFTFLTVRSYLGALVLLPVMALFSRKKGEHGETSSHNGSKRRMLLTGGILCGIALFTASILQQIGILYTPVGKAGFITAMYIVFVPVFGIFLKKKTGIKTWLAVVIAVGGLYLLCITGSSFSLQKGDLLVLACAFGFTIHILIIDHFSPYVDGIQMSCIQFLVCALLSTIGMIALEQPSLSSLLLAWKPVLYTGILSSGVGYTLQIIGQKGLNPTTASLIMSLESVVSVIAGWLLLHQKLSLRELAGCLLMFVAIILVQLPDHVGNSELPGRSA